MTAALLLNVIRAAQLGVFHNAPIWVLHAVPAALTQMFVKSAPRYTISKQIDEAYFVAPWVPPGSRAEVNKAITRISKHNFSGADPSYLLLGPDDKGIVDFVEFSFRAFASRIEAVAVLYYVLLSLSVLVFAWRYWSRPVAMASVACVLFSMHQFMPIIVFNPQLTSPLALRCMPVLSLVACLHCAYFCWSPRSRSSDVVAVLVQAALIVLVVHIRSTAIWQIVGVGAVFALGLYWRRSRSEADRSSRRLALLSALPAVSLIAGLGALNVYRHAVFPQEYLRGEQIMTRVIWHNAFSGFALHPELSKKYSLRIDDVSIIAAAGRYLKEQGRDDLWKELGGESPGFNRIKWAKFDAVVGDMLIAVCKTHLRACTETFIRDKPYYFIDTLMWYYRVRQVPAVADAFVSEYFGDVGKQQLIATSAELDKKQLSAAPWTGGFVVLWLFLAAGIVAATAGGSGLDESLCMAVITAASAAPSIFGYPAPLGMVDSAVVISATLQTIAVLLAVWAIRANAQRLRRNLL